MGRGEGLVGRVRVAEKEKGRRPWAGLPGEKKRRRRERKMGRPGREEEGRKKGEFANSNVFEL
jgi:hypothetical protein